MNEDLEISEILSELPKRKAAFVRCYVEHENASQAARDAGYAQKNANTAGCRLMKDEAIKNAIKRVREKLSRVNQFTLEEAFKENERLMKLAEKNRQFNAVHRFHETKVRMAGYLIERHHIESDKPLFNLVIGGITPPDYAKDVTPPKKEIEGE